MSLHEEQTRALIEAAERDCKTFSILVRDPDSPIERTLFHAQQALEKSLKAALVSKGVLFPRTHDLFQLFDLAVASGLKAPAARDLMARLGPYAVEFRYLGVIAPEVSRDEAASAVTACLDWVRELLK